MAAGAGLVFVISAIAMAACPQRHEPRGAAMDLWVGSLLVIGLALIGTALPLR